MTTMCTNKARRYPLNVGSLACVTVLRSAVCPLAMALGVTRAHRLLAHDVRNPAPPSAHAVRRCCSGADNTYRLAHIGQPQLGSSWHGRA